MPMYRGFLPRYMFAQHIPYMYHRYTIGSMKGRMVHVWYMSEKHIPSRKPFIHQSFRVVMVYGYMFVSMHSARQVIFLVYVKQRQNKVYM